MATTAKDYRGHQQVDDFSPRKSENLDEFPSDKPPHLDSTRTYQTEDMAHTEDKDSSESSGRAPRSFRQSASEAARKAISERMSNSVIGNALSMSEIPEFDIKEFVLGKRLGKGAFSDVDEIRAMVLFQTNTARKPRQPPRHSDSMAMNDKESRLFIAEHCTRASGDSRYALKLLKRDVRKDKERFMSGLCDLAMEVRFLSGLTHPNIIKLRAVSSASEYSSDYFLVLDRLYDTLAKRLLKWQSRKKDLKRFLGQLKDRKGVQLLDFYEDRIERAYDLSAALEYCHSKNIIHRDLKPDNIGFDCRGDIKIFDFGSASELLDEQKFEDGTYKLSKMTGSLRYMAPEVWLGKRYNAACDVYSFTLLLWQILALRQPFSEIVGEEAFIETVVKNNARPPLKKTWRDTLRKVISDCWSQDMNDRMTMAQVKQQLEREVVRLRQGDATGLDHGRRRSTFIYDSDAHKQSLVDGGIMDLSFRSDVTLQK